MVEPVRHRRTKGAATDMFEPKATASHLDTTDIRRKSAKLGNDEYSINHLAGCDKERWRHVMPMPSSPETWLQIELPKISGM
jgi:hypothetical protein